MSILSEIVVRKRSEILEAKNTKPLSRLVEQIGHLPKPRDFRGALLSVRPSIIAEIKQASPSKGVFVANFDHRLIARDFEEGGAAALSVLTDRSFFNGHPDFIADVRDVSQLPVLRKDFILEEYQIYESRALGADAVLLIVRILDRRILQDLIALARSLGLATLVEVHDENDLSIADEAGAELIGINNRDLSDFSVSFERSIELRKKVREGVLTVSESGIRDAADVSALARAGFHAVLVGESLMKSANRVASLRAMIHS